MAIRDHFRRRKSISEPSQGERTSSDPKSPALRLAKTFGWRSAKEEKPKKKTAINEKEADPRERPFNETNLRHQEILNGFSMTFGKGQRPMSRDARSSYYSINVSPGTSRHNSVDVDDSPLRMNPLPRESQFRSVPEEDERS
ncbi:uncharacterized protein CLUP02_03405 [Colletotrichum lupini]|uniref:Uncharacterized protein n=1 Tax=Colletotrichum lupini TaxID=145971 RepID=A0A9Q8WCP9_9PEZI|nr:uncharacterized protein CLUP02_03405 [Colletotrichum lupini]KAK1721789.1 hypothetical protein BDP67DRAFT_389549 [Colletotrichum lupini]UQC77932.1 hypothetical protein CLUP02_03405 [Colletotrichum lupini]